MVRGIITESSRKSIQSSGFIKPGNFDPIDIVDTVNVLFLGPNAALSEKNRRKGQKAFTKQLGSFGGNFSNFSLREELL